MSQAGILNVAGGGGGGTPVQTVTGDQGGPVPPSGNNINLFGGTSTANNANGIVVVGNPATSTETFTLTNRLTGTATTAGAVTTALVTFPLGAVAGTYTIQLNVAGYTSTGPASTSYFEFICAASTGAAARIVSAGDSDEICLEDAALNASDILVTASGNSVVISAQGVVGLTIDWNAVGTYIFVS
jgi:hypothetical protein